MSDPKLPAAILLTLIYTACQGADPGPRPTQGERIGCYDGRAIAMAYAASETFEGWMKQKMAERSAASTAGDRARVAELEALGQRRQAKFHDQAFRGARIDDILQEIATHLPRIRQLAGVTRLEPVNLARGRDVVCVDVTSHLVELFKPSQETLDGIAELQKLALPTLRRMP